MAITAAQQAEPRAAGDPDTIYSNSAHGHSRLEPALSGTEFCEVTKCVSNSRRKSRAGKRQLEVTICRYIIKAVRTPVLHANHRITLATDLYRAISKYNSR
jgi:hypothetical protein